MSNCVLKAIRVKDEQELSKGFEYLVFINRYICEQYWIFDFERNKLYV